MCPPFFLAHPQVFLVDNNNKKIECKCGLGVAFVGQQLLEDTQSWKNSLFGFFLEKLIKAGYFPEILIEAINLWATFLFFKPIEPWAVWKENKDKTS